MLDDNLDPTPLLKEIRDDKVATIIIDANASVSYLILKKVSFQTSVRLIDLPAHTQELTLLLSTQQDSRGFVFFSFTRWEIQVASRAYHL